MLWWATGWRLDPHIPGRLWFDVQSQGTHTGKFGGPFSMIWPSNKRVVTPPQVICAKSYVFVTSQWIFGEIN